MFNTKYIIMNFHWLDYQQQCHHALSDTTELYKYEPDLKPVLYDKLRDKPDRLFNHIITLNETTMYSMYCNIIGYVHLRNASSVSVEG